MSSHAWTHKRSCTPSDPINVIFRDISMQQISNFLTKNKWRLSKSRFSNQFLPDYSRPFKKDMQDSQFVLGRFYNRYHIRLWAFPDAVIGGVHRDIFKWSKGHVSADFESSEKYLANVCRMNSDWIVTDDAIDLGNADGGYGRPYNNGKATEVRRK